jgi:DNA polymerase I
MRSFMIFPENKIGAYLDWRAQEVGVAAALSGDETLMSDCQAGDIYYALAKMCELTRDPDFRSWKKQHPDTRQRMKALQLGINYGMGVPSLARGLDRHPLIASTIIEKHKRRYPQFWEWRAQQVDDAMTSRRMKTVFGWPLHIKNSPNERTLFNFPIQGGGAECLRLAAWRLCEADIVPNMLVHDAILFELESEEQINHAVEIMKAAGRDVCNGFEIGVDIEKINGGTRYVDKRSVAKEMWNTMMEALGRIGEAP